MTSLKTCGLDRYKCYYTLLESLNNSKRQIEDKSMNMYDSDLRINMNANIFDDISQIGQFFPDSDNIDLFDVSIY